MQKHVSLKPTEIILRKVTLNILLVASGAEKSEMVESEYLWKQPIYT